MSKFSQLFSRLGVMALFVGYLVGVGIVSDNSFFSNFFNLTSQLLSQNDLAKISGGEMCTARLSELSCNDDALCSSLKKEEDCEDGTCNLACSSEENAHEVCVTQTTLIYTVVDCDPIVTQGGCGHHLVNKICQWNPTTESCECDGMATVVPCNQNGVQYRTNCDEIQG